MQGIIPLGLVTVYLTGTTTPATIYSDSNMTVLSNPFTAKLDGSYIFWVGSIVDIVLSGGIPPNSYPAPRTIVGVGPSGSVSGVTSINGLTGAVFVEPGTGINVATSSPDITISLGSVFAIESFAGQSGTVETGFSFTNPSFTATYSVSPASAQITNTASIDSPLTLTTPFTSGMVTGTFTLPTSGSSVTFTLSATQGTTQTAMLTTTAADRIFAGLGSIGATSTVTASGTSAVLSTSDVLASAGLGAETVGQVFGPFSPSSQAIYLLLTGGSHTFVDSGTGFPFAFNAPITVTFVNANGATITMYLYQSTNPLAGTFSPKVAS